MTDEEIITFDAPRPKPGAGYRLLRAREEIRAGDEWAYAQDIAEGAGGWAPARDSDIYATVAKIRRGERLRWRSFASDLYFRRALQPGEAGP